MLVGDQGEDQFWIATGKLPENSNRILDFEMGIDRLGIGGLAAVNRFSDLELIQVDRGTIIKVAGQEIALLQNIAATDLSADNFFIQSIFPNRLEEILERGFVKVGVSDQTPGFSVEENGEYIGFDADLGRALAAALFGDPEAVQFVNQTFDEPLSNVAKGVVDVSAQSITASLTRDGAENVDFAPVYFYDGQNVLVKEDSGINSLTDLDGLPIGVLESTTSVINLEDTFNSIDADLNLVSFLTDNQLYAAYENGDVAAISIDRSNILGRIPTLSDPGNAKILNEVLSKEPLAMVVPENESEWSSVVRWTTNALIQAEEFGITSENLNEIIASTNDPAIKRFLGVQEDLGTILGLENDFVVEIIEAVGNYGEIYDRHFGDLGLPRGLNNIWTIEGGLLYSPPFSGRTESLGTEIIDNDDRNVLEEVLERGYVKVGVDDNLPGLSQQVNGEFFGVNPDAGRALAAALFGDPNAVEFVVFSDFSQSFADTANGVVDVTINFATQNLARDGALGVDFTNIYAYNTQAILSEEGLTELADLAGKKIAVEEGTTALQNLEDAFARIGATFEPVIVESSEDLLIPFLTDAADAVSSDLSLVASATNDIFSRANEFPPEQVARLENSELVDEFLSKEPASFMVDENQSEWADVVKWVNLSTVQAEEFGINSENVGFALDSDNSAIRRFLGVEGNLGESLGIRNDFAFNAVAAIGNTSELVERNFGDIVNLADSGNVPYTEGGLFYSLPFI